MTTVGTVCNMQTNKLFLTLIDLNVYDDPGFIEVCYSYSGAEQDRMVKYRSTLKSSRLSIVALKPQST